MTTNVFDGAVRVVATDSRWSWKYLDYLVYLDDTGFDKIQVLPDLVVMFAGRGDLVQAWRDFLASPVRLHENQPKETKEVSVCMVDALTGEFVRAAGGVQHLYENSRFAGTGGRYACDCWVSNRDAIRAVETAKKKDFCSGGDVRYVDILGGKNNLLRLVQNQLTIGHVNAALHNRGLAMKISENVPGTPVPFKVAASNDDGLAAFGQQVANGELPPSAPFEGMDREWTPEEKQGIKDALSKYGWK